MLQNKLAKWALQQAAFRGVEEAGKFALKRYSKKAHRKVKGKLARLTGLAFPEAEEVSVAERVKMPVKGWLKNLEAYGKGEKIQKEQPAPKVVEPTYAEIAQKIGSHVKTNVKSGFKGASTRVMTTLKTLEEEGQTDKKNVKKARKSAATRRQGR